MTAKPLINKSFQAQSIRKNVAFDLRSPGLLARYPMIGLILFLFGSIMFAGLTYNLLAHGPLLAWDNALANTLPAIGLQSPPFVKDLMTAGFYLGRDVIAVLDGLLCIFLLYKRYWQELAMITIGWTGSALLFYFISTFIDRARPPTQIWIIVNIPGFPSGHATSVITFYGLMAYLIASKMTSAFWKGVVVAAAFLMIGFVGFSRIFTGGHYLTDILSGYALGIAWFGVVYTLIEIITQKIRNRNVKKD